ncbi:ParB N-terminal domain-containing protein [Fibrobacter sp. UWH4]|uniref:ParB N-terminal domain-containing protein n=1 Tax=Fibrobacter sp. UWH4 TaxID=1896210 RepID=UPI00091A623E|nr:ParB N-terminal domain-containing protein [Fibrobacter sp. UWH4]SHL03960.1 ParB family protein [Fibrobacter sp. UWH4]
MQIIEKPLGELRPYENNPRINTDAVDKVANSIREFGFQVPIVIDRNGVIAAGHTRYEAAKRLGLETVPCVVASELSDKQIKAYRLADNKVAEIAAWDFGKLNSELAELSDQFDFSDYGFNAFSADFSTEQDSDAGEGEGGPLVEDDNYNITYEIAFNDEDEQSEWYRFIAATKKRFPEKETVAERILCAVREWMKEG